MALPPDAILRPAKSSLDCLPIELLTLILQWAVNLDKRINGERLILLQGEAVKYYEELACVRLVCKKWNRMVERNPAFWIYMSDTFPPRLVHNVTTRAPGTKNLLVELRNGDRWVPILCRTIVDADNHTAFMDLSQFWTFVIIRFALANDLLQIISQPTPCLHHVEAHHSARTSAFVGLEELSRPIQMQCEVLRVTDSVFPWTMISIENLVHVTVNCYLSCPYFSQGFIDFLRSSSRLESLRLRLCRNAFSSPIQLSSIDLPRLTMVEFLESPTAIDLLQAISSPTPTKVVVREKAEILSTQDQWVAAALIHTDFKCTVDLSIVILPGEAVRISIGSIDLTLQSGSQRYLLEPTVQFCAELLKLFSDTSGATVMSLLLNWDLAWNIGPLIQRLDLLFPNIRSLRLECLAFPTTAVTHDCLEVLSQQCIGAVAIGLLRTASYKPFDHAALRLPQAAN
ncbi:hypothetical protein FRB90_009484 [Tulasnella sp. 427]|nr:hypothetical protein FRB90_009484 [Tulasnella sp. 427]